MALNKCPKKCENCKCEEFKDLSTCWKCKKCGKNHGKTRIRILHGTLPPGKKLTTKNAEVIVNTRSDNKTSKVIDRNRKMNYTVIENEKGVWDIINYRYW